MHSCKVTSSCFITKRVNYRNKKGREEQGQQQQNGEREGVGREGGRGERGRGKGERGGKSDQNTLQRPH